MSELTAGNAGQVLEACQTNLGAIAESFNQCFNANYVATLVEGLEMWPPTGSGPNLIGPGLLAAFEVGETGLLVAVPESGILPDWIWQPSLSERARLDTLPMEWSLNLLPEELSPQRFSCDTTPELDDAVAQCAPTADAVCLRLRLALAESPEAEVSQVWVIWPVMQPMYVAESAGAEPGFDVEPQRVQAAAPPRPSAAVQPDARGRHARQLLKLPVPIVVKLAEKRILLGQLLGLGPGAIVTFEKSCEDLLDLCVNNQVFCRGEAVKIGEKFGLKICELGEEQTRHQAVRGNRVL